VSPAVAYWRRVDDDRARVIAATLDAARAALPQAKRLLPPGWQAAVHQTITGASYQLEVRPSPDAVEVFGYLSPPTPHTGWSVRIHNRSRGIGFPIYVPGGARAAEYATVAEAITAAARAIRTERCRPY
jgi:hypothetical protein